MKISYRTHAIMERLESGELGLMHLPEADVNTLKEPVGLIEDKPSNRFQVLQLKWKICANRLRQDIKIITDPFYDAFRKAKEKLSTSELIEEILSGSSVGTLIYENTVTCYLIEDGEFESKRIHAGTFFVFYQPEKGKLTPMVYATISPTQKFEPLFVSSVIKKAKDVNKYLEGLFNDTILLLNFIKYAEIQTKYLPGSQKVIGINCKYINETKSNVKILDSTWFTELVKSDAFKVRGHFRLQPKKKEGVWTKELIWIKDFEKSGYVRKAGKDISGEISL